MRHFQILCATAFVAVASVGMVGCSSGPSGEGRQVGSQAGEAIGREAGAEHGPLGSTLGSLFGRTAGGHTGDQVQKASSNPPATTQPAK